MLVSFKALQYIHKLINYKLSKQIDNFRFQKRISKESKKLEHGSAENGDITFFILHNKFSNILALCSDKAVYRHNESRSKEKSTIYNKAELDSGILVHCATGIFSHLGRVLCITNDKPNTNDSHSHNTFQQCLQTKKLRISTILVSTVGAHSERFE